MEKFLEYIQEASKIIRAIDHMLYVTFPLVKDNKMLLKILIESQKSIAYCINAILQYEYLYKRIKLYKDAKSNLQTFTDKCSKRYNITADEIKEIQNLFKLVEAHKKSPFEFSKADKIVILSDNMRQEAINLEKTKEFLALAKEILTKTQKTIISKE
jgi:hypothetical protein